MSRKANHGVDLESPLVTLEDGKFFRRLVANTSEGLLTIDEGSTIVFANPAIEEILGYTPEELIGSSKMTLIPERLQDAHAAGLEAYLRTGEKHIDWDGIELPALHKDGHEVPVLISLREHEHDGERRLFTGLFRDISEQKLRERRFEAVFNNTYQFTGLLEPDGTLIEANETALSFGGLDRSDVVGKPLWEAFWFQSNDRAREIVLEGVEVARDGEFFREEVRVQGADQTAIIDFSIRPVTDHRGDIRWLLPEGRNVTDLKMREQHLRVLHRLLRHNLRNDLNVINGFAETLETQLEDDKSRQHAATIRRTSQELIEMNETAKQLADVALDRDWRQESMELWPVLTDAVDELGRTYPESTIVVPDPTDVAVMADDRLETVVHEVVENGIEHTTDPEPAVEIDIVTSADAVDIIVVDDGPGIPKSEQTGVFDERPVTQTDHGSGLGLWLVELILDDYGGTLSYDTRPVEGSRVTISLPRRTTTGSEST
ncbi:PAS domain S-box protein [Salinadaptatus halalkaliphilus]|uniref:PAS domain S-box protein n=1 Tax=Salinadaptatus halalkaliphilus TaxID=2419781 RepID=A0A4S3TMC6_9EURY|nr:PAS domain S-box protein [Salinadaptatus halalkaliphilus]THE65381.1 PAS domain S-box protein [Salinadaptatus halalkaliphilus]